MCKRKNRDKMRQHYDIGYMKIMYGFVCIDIYDILN